MTAIFPDSPVQSFDRCRRLARLILQANRQFNLTAAGTLDDLLLRHIADSLVPLRFDIDLLQAPQLTVMDFGSGAGLPGLPLALARPGWQVTSLEATGKKARFQQLAAETLPITNVRIRHGRAEQVAHQPDCREQFDLVTARAVAALPILAELGLPLVRPGGLLLAWKGPDIQAELQQAAGALDRLQGRHEQTLPYSLADTAAELNLSAPADLPVFHLVLIRKTAPLPNSRYPRPYSAIKKHPL